MNNVLRGGVTSFVVAQSVISDVGLSPPYHLFGGTQLNQRVIIEEELVAGNLPTSRSLSVIPESQLFTYMLSYLLQTGFF